VGGFFVSIKTGLNIDYLCIIMTIDGAHKFINFLIRQSNSGVYLSPSEIDLILNRAQTQYFNKLCKEYDNLTLKVFSSYKIYGWDEIQKQYEQSELYQKLNQNPNIQNIGFVSHEELKKELAKSHIFTYPCVWKECGCTSLLEAMSAGLLCVHPSYGPLPELASNWTMMYDYHEDKSVHEQIFYEHLKKAINIVNEKNVQRKLKYQREYVNYFYNWERRTQEWIELLKSLEHLDPKIKQQANFSYS
jgi:glycosyltransferase involved in cell wall biosynthesis